MKPAKPGYQKLSQLLESRILKSFDRYVHCCIIFFYLLCPPWILVQRLTKPPMEKKWSFRTSVHYERDYLLDLDIYFGIPWNAFSIFLISFESHGIQIALKSIWVEIHPTRADCIYFIVEIVPFVHTEYKNVFLKTTNLEKITWTENMQNMV